MPEGDTLARIGIMVGTCNVCSAEGELEQASARLEQLHSRRVVSILTPRVRGVQVRHLAVSGRLDARG